MSAVHPGPRMTLVVGVSRDDARRWFPDVRGMTIWQLGDELPGRLRAGLPGSAFHVLLCSELTDGQVAGLRKKAQDRGLHLYGPTDAADLGRMAHRLLGLTPPACRPEEMEKEACQQLALEAWAAADDLKRQLAAFKPAEIAALRSDAAAAQAKVASLEAELRGSSQELQRRATEISGLAVSLADVQGKEAGATARADELHAQLESSRSAAARLREGREETERELGKARADLAEMNARLEQTLEEIERVRTDATAKVKAAQDRSSEHWRSALLAEAREPDLRAQLEAVRKANDALRAKAKADAARIRQLGKEVETAAGDRAELARLKSALGAMFAAEPAKKKGKTKK